MTPEAIEMGKAAAGWLATIVAAAVTAWRVRGRRESRAVPHYTGPPDDAPRRISRKEWHDLSDRVQAHEWKVNLLRKDDDRLTSEMTELQVRFERHVSDVAQAVKGFDRLDERVKAHMAQSDQASERAEKDRDEILQRIDGVTARLDRNGG